jgi:hypothetical protein
MTKTARYLMRAAFKLSTIILSQNPGQELLYII